jgi:hypothetical protein
VQADQQDRAAMPMREYPGSILGRCRERLDISGRLGARGTDLARWDSAVYLLADRARYVQVGEQQVKILSSDATWRIAHGAYCDYLKAIPLQRFSQHIADGFVVLGQ